MLRRSWASKSAALKARGGFFCSCSMHVGSAIRGSDTVESIGREIAVTEGEGGRNMSKQRISDRQEEGKELKEMKPVLIVEDEAIMRESLRDWLEDGGYEVETAEQGEEALDKIAKKEFGVAVLDLRLPGENGLEVLKRATEQDPKLKGIIITAYPSIETAVTAMKMGAVNYIVKPFTPDALEKAIQEILGPVQAEIKPDKIESESPAAQLTVVDEAEAEEVTTITEDEIPNRLEQGQAHFEAGHFGEALKEFESILSIAPGHIETRVWVRKAKEALARPQVEIPEGEEAAEEGVKVNECIWARMGVVSYRICTHDYDCLACEFDQAMQEKLAAGEPSEDDDAAERLAELPGPQRLCRYALKTNVSYRLCTRAFKCATCEFEQAMQDATERKMAKLSARREALQKKKAGPIGRG
jgi:DNA-binding response OmpR family regulator